MDRTMTKYKCNSCGGEYSDTCADGLAYYHACPLEKITENEYKERSDKRDENAGKKLEGKGRKEVV